MTNTTTDLPAATKLALDRTRLAYERTLMAWVRTATSLISFGFSIYKFFQYLRESQHLTEPQRLLGPREFALLMIGIGVVSLLIATVQHRRNLQALQAEYGIAAPSSLAAVLAALISGLGIFGMVAVALRQ